MTESGSGKRIQILGPDLAQIWPFLDPENAQKWPNPDPENANPRVRSYIDGRDSCEAYVVGASRK